MELEGKILSMFWEWLFLDENLKKYKLSSKFTSKAAIKVSIMSRSLTERFGIYCDFFESKGVFLNHITLPTFIVGKENITDYLPPKYYTIITSPTINNISTNISDSKNITMLEVIEVVSESLNK